VDRVAGDKKPKIAYVCTLRGRVDKGVLRSRSMVNFTSEVRKLLKATTPYSERRCERRTRQIVS
jgi:hypothetical protein